jgi:hypothetical protein
MKLTMKRYPAHYPSPKTLKEKFLTRLVDLKDSIFNGMYELDTKNKEIKYKSIEATNMVQKTYQLLGRTNDIQFLEHVTYPLPTRSNLVNRPTHQKM